MQNKRQPSFNTSNPILLREVSPNRADALEGRSAGRRFLGGLDTTGMDLMHSTSDSMEAALRNYGFLPGNAVFHAGKLLAAAAQKKDADSSVVVIDNTRALLRTHNGLAQRGRLDDPAMGGETGALVLLSAAMREIVDAPITLKTFDGTLLKTAGLDTDQRSSIRVMTCATFDRSDVDTLRQAGLDHRNLGMPQNLPWWMSGLESEQLCLGAQFVHDARLLAVGGCHLDPEAEIAASVPQALSTMTRAAKAIAGGSEFFSTAKQKAAQRETVVPALGVRRAPRRVM